MSFIDRSASVRAESNYSRVLADKPPLGPVPLGLNPRPLFTGKPHPKMILDINIEVWRATLSNHENILKTLDNTVEDTDKYINELKLRNAAQDVLNGLRAYKLANDEGRLLIDPDAKI